MKKTICFLTYCISLLMFIYGIIRVLCGLCLYFKFGPVCINTYDIIVNNALIILMISAVFYIIHKFLK